MYTIKPIFHGVFENFEKTIFTYRTDAGTKLTVPLVSYLVQGEDCTFIVDSGPPNPELAKTRGHRPVLQATYLQDELRRLGVEPSDIDFVVLTHMHWDHSYNLELFPNKPVYVQKRELEYGVNPVPCDAANYCFAVPDTNAAPSWVPALRRFQVLDGEETLRPGIKLIPLPGHTCGLQGVLVDTEEGKYMITSDHYPLYENYEKGCPAGICVNMIEWYQSHEKVKRLADFILPGHDMKVLDRTVYGVVNQ